MCCNYVIIDFSSARKYNILIIILFDRMSKNNEKLMKVLILIILSVQNPKMFTLK